jgi:Fic family protein
MNNINRAFELKTELDSLRPINQEQEQKIMQKFRLDWNYHSNKLEGNSLSFGETKALILHGITAQGKPLKDHFEITGHDEAIKWIEEKVKQEIPITETFIRELHQMILKEPYWVDAVTDVGQSTRKLVEVGKYKTQPNHVLTKTGEVFYFATPQETPAKMQELVDWLKKHNSLKEADPIILASEFHYRFIRIHPFDDGNGRIARILMNLILMQHGYPPAIIKMEDKENYFSKLRIADGGDLEPFVEYIAENVIRSIEIMIRGAKGEDIEESDDLDKELALLEGKLKAKGKKIDFKSRNEAIIFAYNNSIRPLLVSLVEHCSKFNKFYLENQISSSGVINIYSVSQIESPIDSIDEGANALVFFYSFKKFKFNDDFDYWVVIRCEFFGDKYKVFGHSYIPDGITFPQEEYLHIDYQTPLNEDQIKSICKQISDRHKKIIEVKGH